MSDTTWEQETIEGPGMGGNRDRGAGKWDITAGTRTHTQEKHTMTEGPARLTPTGRRTTTGDARPQHTPPKPESDAIRITAAHAHQPPETKQGREGTPARGKRATPTEEATKNTAAQPTTTPSPPGSDPSHHKGHLTGTGRGQRHGHSAQS